MSLKKVMPEEDELVEATFNVMKSRPDEALSYKELNDQIIKRLNLDESVKDVPASGSSYLKSEFDKRCSCARNYLKNSGLIENSRNEERTYIWSLTDNGISCSSVVGSEVIEYGDAYLNHLDEKNRGKEARYLKELDEALGTIQRSKQDGRPLEKVVYALLDKMGFVNIVLTTVSNDGGIDILATYNKNEILGSRKFIFQCKQWINYHHGMIDEKEIKKFRKSLKEDYDEAVFVTVGKYTPHAKAEATKEGNKKIRLIDGDELVRLLIKYEVLFKPTGDYSADLTSLKEINQIDSCGVKIVKTSSLNSNEDDK